MRPEIAEISLHGNLVISEALADQRVRFDKLVTATLPNTPTEVVQASRDVWLALYARNLIPVGQYPAFDRAWRKAGGQKGVIRDLKTLGGLWTAAMIISDYPADELEKIGYKRRVTFGGTTPDMEIKLASKNSMSVLSWDSDHVLMFDAYQHYVVMVARGFLQGYVIQTRNETIQLPDQSQR